MNTLDYSVFGAYLLVTLGVGMAARLRARSEREFHVAGGTMSWWAIGLSVMVSAFSVVNYAAFPGEVYTHGLYVWMVFPAFGVSGFFVWKVVIPAYRRMRTVSAHALLEREFGAPVRRLAAVLFVLWRLAWMGIVLHAAGALLSGITGLPRWALIVAAGASCTAYTMAGGMRSVIWTDVLQAGVLFGSLVAALVMAFGAGTAGGVLRACVADGLAKPFLPGDSAVWRLDPTARMTVWSCLLGGTTAFVARYGADQMIVQRYFSARSLADARRGFILNLVCAIVALVLLTALGFAIHAWRIGPGGETPGMAAEPPIRVFARFIAGLPSGMVGLLVSALFASAMSSVDSGIHACTTCLTADFGRGRGAAARPLWRLRGLTLTIGAAAVGLAAFAPYLGTLFEMANKVVNGLGSPILALFVLAWVGPRRAVTSRGVFWGGVGGLAWSLFVILFVRNLALHYYALANFGGTYVLALVLSRCLAKAPQKSSA